MVVFSLSQKETFNSDLELPKCQNRASKEFLARIWSKIAGSRHFDDKTGLSPYPLEDVYYFYSLFWEPHLNTLKSFAPEIL